MSKSDFSKEDIEMFVEFLTANGFDPNNYYNILELNRSVPESISQYLKEYRQFLLSNRVSYDDLEKYHLRGANGNLNLNGISIPKTIERDEYFSHHRPLVPHDVHGSYYPDMREFDSIVILHNWDNSELEQVRFTLNYPICHHFIGFIKDMRIEDKLFDSKLNYYDLLAWHFYDISSKKHEVVHEKVSSKNKELYLIRPKKNKIYGK